LNLSIERKKIFLFPVLIFSLILSVTLVFAACSFDYGADDGPDKSKPDIVMENLEYVRVRGGDPLVRFQAELAERYEERQTMELWNFSFEQMEDKGETVNADGRAGLALVLLDSGDISLKGGVRIRVDSEDVIIRTAELEWRDKPKTLFGGEEDEVDIERSDGTIFTGRGFFADARNRIWSFSGEVKGIYVEKEDEKESKVEETEEIEVSIEDETPVDLTGETEKLVPSPEEYIPVTEQPVYTVDQIPESKPLVPAPAQIPEPKPSIPAPAQVPEPKPSVPAPAIVPQPKPSIPAPAQAPEPKPSVSAPAIVPEPKPSIPVPAPSLPLTPEDK